jgi:hypothetical protein
VGIDPHTVDMLSSLLEKCQESQSTRIILSLAGDEYFPEWITNLVYLLHDYRVHSIGNVEEVVESIATDVNTIRQKDISNVTEDDAIFLNEAGRIYESSFDKRSREGSYNPDRVLWRAVEARRYRSTWHYMRGRRFKLPAKSKVGDLELKLPPKYWLSRDDFPTYDTEEFTPGEPIVEMDGIKVTYGNSVALGDWEQDINGSLKDGLWWKIHRGERWGIFGPNGNCYVQSPFI